MNKNYSHLRAMLKNTSTRTHQKFCDIQLFKQLLFLNLFLWVALGESFAQTLYINEFMASNETTIADESGNFEDWIEIYNAGSSDVNLAGYYISDDAVEPTLWQIADTDASLTTVPAGGYLLLWADKDTDDGANHIDLKLGSGGEDIVLSLPDGTTVVDGLTFGAQTDDISYGRSSDGAADFQFFGTATPNAENVEVSVPTYTVTLNVPIAMGSDDAEEFQGGGVTLSSSDIELGTDGANAITAGLRFANVSLSDEATIVSAYIQFYADEIQTGSSSLQIIGEASGNASPFQNIINNISSRTNTSNSVNWTPAPWPTVGESGDDQQSPDLSSIVQEIIETAGWSSGNAMVFKINGSGTRTTYAHEQNSSRVARLVIEAEVPLPSEPILPIYINEIAAAGTTYIDASGKQEDWIELYNPNNVAVDLGGLYLTDDYGELDQWQIASNISIPAGGYLTFFADKDIEEGPLHADFSLKSGGEEVALVQLLSTGLTIIDSMSYDEMSFLASYGRSTDGGNNLIFFGEITPDQSNNGALEYLAPPSFSLESGKYSSSQSVSLSHPLSNVNIYYTTDGSLPDVNATLYTGAINVTNTQSIRAIAVKPSHANSLDDDATYLINENRNLPIIYLTTDPDNFFDDEIGIYVDGTNGVIGYCATEPVNWARDWERPANFKMFMPDGEVAFDVNAGVEISGACSRNHAMKSLAINLRDKIFGDEMIDYELFPQRDHSNYQRLKIRGSGQDYFRLAFRDMLNQTMLFDKVDLDLQAGRSVLLYLNGEFWGIHNLREKYAGEYFEVLYDVDEDDLDIIKSPGLAWRDIKKGDDVIYNQLFDFVSNNALTNSTNYEYFESQVDVNEFTNYWVAMTYLANYDWPANNLTVWRERKEGAKWRYGVADTDGSTNNILSTSAAPEFNTFALVNDGNSSTWPNHQNSTLFLRKLLDRTDYRDEFIQRTCSFIELIFNEDRALALTDSIVNLLEPNIQDHLDKWGFDGALGGSVAKWNEWIDAYEVFWQDRPANMRQHLNDFYNLDGYYDLSFNYDANTNGDVVVNSNGMKIPYDYTGTYFRNIPIRVKAIAKEGYDFAYWLETGVTDDEIDFVSNQNATLTPIFVPENGSVLILNCSSDLNEAITNGATSIAVSWSMPMVNSTCATGTTILTQTAGPASGSLFGVGTTTISYEATDDCGNLETCSFDVIVSNGSAQSINFPTISDQSTTSTPFSISATASSGLPVSFTILSGPATISGNTITLAGTEGLVTVRASQAGNAQWQAAANVDRSFNVTTAQSGNCGVTYTTTGSSITLSGLDAPHHIVKLFGPAWNSIFNCLDDCSNPQTIGGLSAGTHHLDVQFYDASWQPLCSFTEDVEIGGSSSSITMSCPAGQTVQIAEGNTVIAVNFNAATASTTCPTNGLSISQIAGSLSGASLAAGTYTIEYSATDDCGNEMTCSFNITVLPPNTQSGSYCEVIGTQPWQQYIQNVTFGSINNTSSKDQYGDFTALTTNVAAGSSLPISLTPGFSWSQNDVYFRVWIDYNQDGDFLDANEVAASVIRPAGTPPVTSPVTQTINIPSTALVGSTRMRVAMQVGAYANACGSFVLGEVEDYTVLIDPSATLAIDASKEILFLNAHLRQRLIELDWATNLEPANGRYVIERSTDSVHYDSIDEVSAPELLSTVVTYFKQADDNPLVGNNYYRIKLTLADGSIKYSNVQMIQLEKQEGDLLLFPNPVRQNLFLFLPDFVGEQATVVVVNQLGNIIDQREVEQLPNAPIHFDLQDQPSGIYLVRVKIGNQKMMTGRVMKVHH